MVEKTLTGVSPRYRIVDENKIAFRDELVDGRAMVWDGGKKTFVKLYKSNAALVRIRIVLNIVVMHEPIHCAEVMLAKNLFIEIPDDRFIFFLIHSDCPYNNRWFFP
jgi:hypothetical protein